MIHGNENMYAHAYSIRKWHSKEVALSHHAVSTHKPLCGITFTFAYFWHTTQKTAVYIIPFLTSISFLNYWPQSVCMVPKSLQSS